MPRVPLPILGALLLGAILSNHATAQSPRELRIGLYNTPAAGGQGAAIDGLLDGLQQQGYNVQPFTDLHPLTLARFDLVYLSDVHDPGSADQRWRADLTEYVTSGGSVLQTWHHHVLGDVGQGVRRIYDSRAMHVVPGHPAIQGVEDFSARAADHIIERVGPRGSVILKNDADEPVAVAGQLGQGKVISCGLALAIPGGKSQTSLPSAEEAKLLDAFFRWLVPEVSRKDRIAALAQKPRLSVTPSRILTAAGTPATFRVDVSGLDVSDTEIRCDGATVSPVPTSEEHAALRGFHITVPTQVEKNETRQIVIGVTLGTKQLEETVSLETIHGEIPSDEIRGVWLHARPDRHPETVMPELAKLGINMAVLRIAGGTAAYYASKVQPDVFDPLAPDGDWLAEAVKHAHANGIEIHPYLNNCVVEDRTSPESLKRLRAAGRLQVGPGGEPIDWFCPSQEINFEAIERPMLEIVSNYDVDGIQYDFIRYPNQRGCFCDVCRKRFERESGAVVEHWPEDCLGEPNKGPRYDDWVRYRASRISALVERISTKIHAAHPDVKISAAVFRNWPECVETNGQDWVHWCEQGWLDMVCPMNYTLDPVLFAQCAANHRAAVPEGFPILQGIGIASGRGRMTSSEEVAIQIAIARRYNSRGWIGFAYQPGHTTKLLAPLKLD